MWKNNFIPLENLTQDQNYAMSIFSSLTNRQKGKLKRKGKLSLFRYKTKIQLIYKKTNQS